MNDLRQALESAVEQHDQPDDSVVSTQTPAERIEPAGDDGKPPIVDASDKKPAAPEPKQPATTPAPAKQASSEKPSKESVSQDGTPAQKGMKPPVSWRPEAREKWGTVDPAIQAEVHRRDKEVSEALRTSADSRKFHQEFNQLTAPYQQFFAAEGSNPMEGYKYYLQTAALFRVGAPQAKAQAVAQIVRQYGIDIRMLDDALAGVMQGQGNGQSQPQVDPAFAQLQQQFSPVIEYVNSLKAREQQIVGQNDQKLSQTLEEFASDPANEFFEDVREDIADILEMAARRGTSMSLQDAYSRAIMLHPTIGKIVEQRKLATSLQSQNAAAQRARNAAVSVPSSGAPSHSGTGNQGTDLRSTIVAAMDDALSTQR